MNSPGKITATFFNLLKESGILYLFKAPATNNQKQNQGLQKCWFTPAKEIFIYKKITLPLLN